MKRFLGLLIAVLVFAPGHAWGKQPSYFVDIREEMAAEEFQSAGLTALSDAQVESFNAWFAKYTWRIRKEGAEPLQAKLDAALLEVTRLKEIERKYRQIRGPETPRAPSSSGVNPPPIGQMASPEAVALDPKAYVGRTLTFDECAVRGDVMKKDGRFSVHVKSERGKTFMHNFTTSGEDVTFSVSKRLAQDITNLIVELGLRSTIWYRSRLTCRIGTVNTRVFGKVYVAEILRIEFYGDGKTIERTLMR